MAPKLVVIPGGPRFRKLTHLLGLDIVVKKRGDCTFHFDNRTRRSRRLVPGSITSRNKEDSDIVPDVVNLGWKAYALWNNDTGTPISFFSTTFVVPEPPSKNDGQTIFLFNSLEDSSFKTILQPVLQWGESFNGGGDYWSVCSWFGDASSHFHCSGRIEVDPGQQLTGIITLCNVNNGKFSYQCQFLGIEETLLQLETDREFDVASETLETWNIDDCDCYPDSLFTEMTGIQIYTGAVFPTVNWTIRGNLTGCKTYATIRGSEVIINYGKT